MTKIEELKAAYEAATPGDWEYDDGLIYGPPADSSEEAYLVCDVSPGMIGVNEQDEHNINFIALAHNLMPQILGAATLLKDLRNSLSQYDNGEWYLHDGTEPTLDYIDEVLEKLT